MSSQINSARIVEAADVNRIQWVEVIKLYENCFTRSVVVINSSGSSCVSSEGIQLLAQSQTGTIEWHSSNVDLHSN